jgi:hypothetical protein
MQPGLSLEEFGGIVDANFESILVPPELELVMTIYFRLDNHFSEQTD